MSQENKSIMEVHEKKKGKVKQGGPKDSGGGKSSVVCQQPNENGRRGEGGRKEASNEKMSSGVSVIARVVA